MANQLLTTDLISNMALAEFSNNSPYIMTASRMYQSDFTQSGYKIGDTLRVRRQNNYIVGDGSTAVPQDIVETVEEIKIEHQYHAYINYTVEDLVLRIEDFNSRFIQPAIQNIKSQFELDLGRAAELQLYSFTGTAGTPINSFNTVDTAGAKLLEMAVDISRDAYMAMTVRDGTALKSALLNQFTPMFNEEIVRQSAIGHLSYFDIFQSQLIPRHLGGAGTSLADPLVINGQVNSGNTLVISGATINTPNYFLPGDVISIGGVQSTNRITRIGTGQNMQFVVTAAAGSDGAGQIILQINPTIISDSSSPLKNVSNPILNNSPVTVVPSHNVNVAYPPRGLDIVCPPLYRLETPKFSTAVDNTTGLSLSVAQDGDINSYQNRLRIDLLCGFKWHPEYAVRVLS